MTCEQFNDLLVDYLYKTLEGNAAKRVGKHLAGCPACTKLAASYDRTLSKTRASLAGALDEDPPSRVRFRAIAAAREYAATSQAPRSLFARLLRLPWFLPTCGAAAVGIITFFVYVNKGAENLPGQRPSPLDEQNVPLASPALENTPAKAPIEKAKPDMPAPTNLGSEERKAKRATAVSGGAASAMAKAKRGASLNKVDDQFNDRSDTDRLEKSGLAGEKGQATYELNRDSAKDEKAPWPIAKPTTKRPSTIDEMELDEFKEAPEKALPAKTHAQEAELQGTTNGRQVGRDRRDFAEPPPMAPPSAQGRSAPAAGVPSPMVAPAAPPPAASPSPSTAPPQRTSAQKKSAEAEQAPSFAQPMEEAAEAPPTRSPKKSETKDTADLDESIKKAERLFTQQNWAASAEAYRDLLRRFPSHADAPKWRGRLAQALANLARDQQTQNAR